MKSISKSEVEAKPTATASLYRSKLTVEIDENTHQKMFGWCRAADTEVSFMMLVERNGSTFKVYDALLAKQRASYAYVEFVEGEVAGLMYKLHKWGRNLQHYRGYGHTHNNFGVFWSGTDISTRDELAAQLPWLLSIVINKQGDMLACVDFKDPEVTIDKVPIVVVKSKKKKKERDYKADIAKNVQEIKWENPQDDMREIVEHTPTWLNRTWQDRWDRKEGGLVSRLWPEDDVDSGWPLSDELDKALLKSERGEELNEEEKNLVRMEIARLEREESLYDSYPAEWLNFGGEIIKTGVKS